MILFLHPCMSVYWTYRHDSVCYQANSGLTLLHILIQAFLSIQTGLPVSMVHACLDQLLLCDVSIKHPVEKESLRCSAILTQAS